MSSLAARLRQETTDLHRRAERAGVMREWMGGGFELAGYTLLLRNLFEVYRALESGPLVDGVTPALTPLRIPLIARVPSLAADLRVLHGPAWETELPFLPEGRRYVERVAQVAAGSPSRLAGHAYVRYMGDMSGGQVLARLVTRATDPGRSGGVAFYRFASVPDLSRFRDEFREALDGLPLDGRERDGVVGEAKQAFALNITLLEAVARQRPASDGQAPRPAG